MFRRAGIVLVLALFATPILGAGPELIHGGSPEEALGVPYVVIVGGLPVPTPQALVGVANWLRSLLGDPAEPDLEESPVTTNAGPVLTHGG